MVDLGKRTSQTQGMNQASVITRLKQNQSALERLGLAHVALFGSTARGSDGPESDVDLAVKFDETVQIDLFRFAAISEQLRKLLGRNVDLVVEPARSARIQAEIDRDRLHVF